MYEYRGERKMEERPEGEQEPLPESESESPVEFLSPEEQERVIHEYAEPQDDTEESGGTSDAPPARNPDFRKRPG